MLRSIVQSKKNKRLFASHKSILVSMAQVTIGLIVACGVASCSSNKGGASSTAPIPGGFKNQHRVTNAGAVRITNAGLYKVSELVPKLISQALGTSGGSKGVYKLTLPSSAIEGEAYGLKFKIAFCYGGAQPAQEPPKCTAEINVANFKQATIYAVEPNELKIQLTIPIRIRNLPVKIDIVNNDFVQSIIGGEVPIALGVGNSGYCESNDYVQLPITLSVALEYNTKESRNGYMKIGIKSLDIDSSSISDNVKFCGSGLRLDLLNLLKGSLSGQITKKLPEQLIPTLNNATCMSSKQSDGSFQCPEDTYDVYGTCRYRNDERAECVSMALGTEMRVNMTSLVSSLAPHANGAFDLLFAGSGSATSINGGITLGLFGGAIPVSTSSCVTPVNNIIPTLPGLPHDFYRNQLLDGPSGFSPDLGIGVSLDFLNYTLKSVYNSGLLCLNVTSELVSSLHAGVLAFPLPSVSQMVDHFKSGSTPASLAISLRPQKPPKLDMTQKPNHEGVDIQLALPDLELDFALWSHTRFIRLFTARLDIATSVFLESSKEGVAIKFPPENAIKFSNVRVLNNSHLLLESEEQLANFVKMIGGVIPSSALAGIPAFKLEDALAQYGLKIVLPKEGVRVNTRTDQKFLGLFANIQQASSALPATQTKAQLTKFELNRENFGPQKLGQIPPHIEIQAQNSAERENKAIEYAYRVNQSPWTTFFADKKFQVHSPYLNFQGKHTVQVISRIKGIADSESEPVSIPLPIDFEAPNVRVHAVENGVSVIDVVDFVSAPKDIRVEARLDEGEWILIAANGKNPMERLVSVTDQASTIEVRVTDENGNSTTVRNPLVRGDNTLMTSPSQHSGGCTLAQSKTNTSNTLAWFSVVGIVGVMLARKKRKLSQKVAALSLSAVFVSAAGCSGNSSSSQSGNSNTSSDDARAKGPIRPYSIGSYLSAVAGKDGKIWVAGYYEGDPSFGLFHADLAVGLLNSSNTVDWQTIDGVPNVPPTRDPTGFRGGVNDLGDDVGMYTAMAIDSSGNPIIAYHDRTNNALKIARFNGETWNIHFIEGRKKGWAGRSNAIAVVNDKPVVAYQVFEPGPNGYGRSKVRVAWATTPLPSAQGNWKLEDIAVEEQTPCIQDFCSEGQKCLAGDAALGFTPTCTPVATGCDETCTDVCVNNYLSQPVCVKPRADIAIYPKAIGSYISIAKTPTNDLALVFYDRIHGNLRGALYRSGQWSVTPANQPLDGRSGDPARDAQTSDRGIAATIAVDAQGNGHVVYVDAAKRQLLYKSIPNVVFSKASPPFVVDDGLTAATDADAGFVDGLHVVGDDAFIDVQNNQVRVVYQDATNGSLRWATIVPEPKPITATRGSFTQEGFAGYFPKIVSNKVLNFYRLKGETIPTIEGQSGDPVILGNVRALPMP